MDPQRVQQKDGKVFAVFDIAIESSYVHSDYKLQQKAKQTIGRTGRLLVFEVTPSLSGRPSFAGRWDENAEALDIDIQEVPIEDVIRQIFAR